MNSMTISEQQFDEYITRAMNELPQEYISGLDNVVIVMADNPSPEQVQKMNLREGHLLLGLYEGVPLPFRSGNALFSMPDKITLFKDQITALGIEGEQLFEQIKRTLWHEIAHYYGLGHSDMDERRAKKAK